MGPKANGQHSADNILVYIFWNKTFSKFNQTLFPTVRLTRNERNIDQTIILWFYEENAFEYFVWKCWPFCPGSLDALTTEVISFHNLAFAAHRHDAIEIPKNTPQDAASSHQVEKNTKTITQMSCERHGVSNHHQLKLILTNTNQKIRILHFVYMIGHLIIQSKSFHITKKYTWIGNYSQKRGVVSIGRYRLIAIGILIIKIKRFHGYLIFITGIAIIGQVAFISFYTKVAFIPLYTIALCVTYRGFFTNKNNLSLGHG